MAKRSIFVILMVSSLLIALQIRGNYATNDAGLDAEEEKLFFQNICGGNEKMAKIHFYLQDLLTGPNPSLYNVAQSSITANSSTMFGQVSVFDDQLTTEPDPSSEEVGRAQGMIAFSDFQVQALTTVLNIYFTSGEYNGSTISLLGRNQYLNEERELTVAGGTGVFRFARGYAITRTHSFDPETRYTVMEYTIYATYNSNKHLK